jgi:hypothetical protein
MNNNYSLSLPPPLNENQKSNIYTNIYNKGIEFDWSKWNEPYKNTFSCKVKNPNGKYVKITKPYAYNTNISEQIKSFVKSKIPIYYEFTIQNGLHTWILYSTKDDPTIQFAAVRVKNVFELGTLHKTIGLNVGAKKIHCAGELVKKDNTITYNIQSGTYTQYILEACDKGKCDAYELETKLRSAFEEKFKGYTFVYTNKTMITKDIEVKKENLNDFDAIGFKVDYYNTNVNCKKTAGGGTRKRKIKRKQTKKHTRK